MGSALTGGGLGMPPEVRAARREEQTAVAGQEPRVAPVVVERMLLASQARHPHEDALAGHHLRHCADRG